MSTSDLDYQVLHFLQSCTDLGWTREAKLAVQAILQQTVTTVISEIPSTAQKTLQLRDIFEAGMKLQIEELQESLTKIFTYMSQTPTIIQTGADADGDQAENAVPISPDVTAAGRPGAFNVTM